MNGDKRFCFTEREFLVLAGILGIERLYGFVPEKGSIIERKDLYQLLFEMVGKKFLLVSENGYKIAPQIRIFLENIKDAEDAISLWAVNGSFSSRCIYQGKETVMLELGGMQGKYFKCCFGIWEEVLDVFLDNGVLLEQNISDEMLYSGEEIGSEELEEEELISLVEEFHNLWEEKDREKMAAYGIHAVLEKRSMIDAMIKARIFIIKRSLFDVIFWQNMGKINIFNYSERKIRELLKEMAGGGQV